ncbi:hypothetical protein [Streptomyces sp. BA2]|uniref:hypothetical protein n=1 Tax=Streptomyces sp. BA2 TaxID=436595 RepID=UPI0013209C76|nr:hypothetical protein [Streptomyces sp. BA2]MWA08104.1 hypothetical protein [Streptomyces sp. BA2]
MDLTGIAALVALAGIPVSVLIAHWQKRTALQQTHALNRAARETAEAAHQAALAQAEASHRAARETALEQAAAAHQAAMAQAAANHQAALQLQAAQAEAAHESAMAQAAANHQTALELQAAQAAAAHRSAMAQAAASHRSALEVARAQDQVEIERWKREKRSAAFEKVHASLDEFRTAFLQNADTDALARIGLDMHGLFHAVRPFGGLSLAEKVGWLSGTCGDLARRIREAPMNETERQEFWDTEVSPRRKELTEAMSRTLELAEQNRLANVRRVNRRL